MSSCSLYALNSAARSYLVCFHPRIVQRGRAEWEEVAVCGDVLTAMDYDAMKAAVAERKKKKKNKKPSEPRDARIDPSSERNNKKNNNTDAPSTDEKNNNKKNNTDDPSTQKKNNNADDDQPQWANRIRDLAPHLAIQATTSPVARARLLAEKLLATAEFLEAKEEEFAKEIGPEVRAALMARAGQSVYAAWLAFHGLDAKRHERLGLVEVVESTSDILLALNQVLPPGDVDDGRLGIVAEIARAFYALNFPERASKLDIRLLKTAIAAWPNEAGRLKPGEKGKWAAINDLAVSVGITSTAPKTIHREWARYAHEVGSRKPWAEKPRS